jgi:hypothetical protein
VAADAAAGDAIGGLTEAVVTPAHENVTSQGIVIPALNAGRTIRATLESLRFCRDQGARVIIVDGHSTDDTQAIAAEYAIDVIAMKGGMYAAINEGCRQLDTEWLTWINADDILFPHDLQGRLRRSGGHRVLYGRVDFIDVGGRFVHSWKSGRPEDLERLYAAGYSPLLQQGTIFHRDVFERLGGFDETFQYVGDADFWWRALEAGFSFSRDEGPPVAGFRLHGRQLSRRFATEMQREHDRMVAAHGCYPQFFSGWPVAARFRVANWRGYAIRALRRHDLGGGSIWPGSYEAPDPLS